MWISFHSCNMSEAVTPGRACLHGLQGVYVGLL